MENLFSNDYYEARRRFRSTACAAGAELEAFELPTDTDLTCDVATLGSAAAQKAVLIVSGTHGQEGFAGSAAQTALLATDFDLHSDVRLVVVHAINPHGFANLTRANENNVDLNRNFIDHEFHPKTDPIYAEMLSMICPDRIDRKRFADSYKKLADRYGRDRVMNAATRGQYDFSTSLNYGGREREWSNLILEKIVQKKLYGVRRIGVIDWHTALGEYGQPCYLCFDPPESRSFRATASWWGENRAEKNGEAWGVETAPKFSGLLFFGVRQFAPDAEVIGGVIEFGTVPIMETFQALIIDRYLKYVSSPGDPSRRYLQSRMMEALNPSSQKWRTSVVQHALEIQHSAIKRAADWDT